MYSWSCNTASRRWRLHMRFGVFDFFMWWLLWLIGNRPPKPKLRRAAEWRLRGEIFGRCGVAIMRPEIVNLGVGLIGKLRQ
jgi:hypothetical protein